MTSNLVHHAGLRPWQDTSLSSSQRAAALVAVMTLDEKVGQLVGLWVGADASGGGVAPHQAEMTADGLGWSTRSSADGLGQLTRPFGTAPVDPGAGARSLAASQAPRSSRPTGSASRRRCTRSASPGSPPGARPPIPVPLSWGATFDPELVEEMAARIGAVDARGRRAPGARPGARRDARLPLGPHRGDDRRGPVPGRHGRRGLRPGPGERRASSPRSSTSPATPPRRAGRNLAPVRDRARASWPTSILPPFEMARRATAAPAR